MDVGAGASGSGEEEGDDARKDTGGGGWLARGTAEVSKALAKFGSGGLVVVDLRKGFEEDMATVEGRSGGCGLRLEAMGYGQSIPLLSLNRERTVKEAKDAVRTRVSEEK